MKITIPKTSKNEPVSNTFEQSNWAPPNQPVLSGQRLTHHQPMFQILGLAFVVPKNDTLRTWNNVITAHSQN